jgi:hypothetical protein
MTSARASCKVDAGRVDRRRLQLARAWFQVAFDPCEPELVAAATGLLADIEGDVNQVAAPHQASLDALRERISALSPP